MAGDTERINVVLSKELVGQLRALVPPRQRSQVIAEALAEKLVRLQQTKAIRESAGAWTDENHPDLMTDDDYEVWIRNLRGSLDERLRRLGLDVEGEDVSTGQ